MPGRPAKAAAAPTGAECRCDCGSLLARWCASGIELKCRRCKRRLVVTVPPPPREARQMS